VPGLEDPEGRLAEGRRQPQRRPAAFRRGR